MKEKRLIQILLTESALLGYHLAFYGAKNPETRDQEIAAQKDLVHTALHQVLDKMTCLQASDKELDDMINNVEEMIME